MTGSDEIRIVIADPQAMFRDALRHLLEQQPGFRVVGEAADGREVIDQVTEQKPDLLLLDLVMPQMTGLQVLRELFNRSARVPTIVLAASIERDDFLEALKSGARGVILKNAPTDLLFKGIRAVMAGEYWIGHNGIVDLIDSLRTYSAASAKHPRTRNGLNLSERELEIMTLVVEGCTNKEIARQFSLSEQTVKHHLTNIFAKVGVSNRLELALFAMHHGLSA